MAHDPTKVKVCSICHADHLEPSCPYCNYVLVDEALRDEGTVIVFGGSDSRGRRVTFGVDRRSAWVILDVLLAGECIEVGE